MAIGEAKWTAIDGSRVRYIEGGRRSGPDVLMMPLEGGLASQEAVWSAIVTVGRAVAVDLPANGDRLRSPDAMASFVAEAIDVLRLRHPHLAASDRLGAPALSTALSFPGALESLILTADLDASGPAAWAEVATLLPRLMLPTLIIATRHVGAGPEPGGELPRCRVHLLEGEAMWPRCAGVVCAWIAGAYRYVAHAPGRS